jgi:hypothetical protein
MAKKKLKKFLKKAAKAALIGGALYAGSKLLKGRKKSVADTAATEGIKWTPGPQIEDAPYIKRKVPKKYTPPFSPTDMWDNPYGSKEGGRVGKKHGGRTRKQFGGGLNRPVAGPGARPVGGVGAPVRPLGYKKGGHVKSMGVAKRGGGVAKR